MRFIKRSENPLAHHGILIIVMYPVWRVKALFETTKTTKLYVEVNKTVNVHQ